jgi:hypothetical protein
MMVVKLTEPSIILAQIFKKNPLFVHIYVEKNSDVKRAYILS